jgi:hypothetical protein
MQQAIAVSPSHNNYSNMEERTYLEHHLTAQPLIAYAYRNVKF